MANIAITSMDRLPDTCHDCPMCHDNPVGNGVILKCLKSHPVFDWHKHTVGRYSNCPLKEYVEDNTYLRQLNEQNLNY